MPQTLAYCVASVCGNTVCLKFADSLWILQALAEAGVSAESLASVEVVGGSSRVPALMQTLNPSNFAGAGGGGRERGEPGVGGGGGRQQPRAGADANLKP